MKHLTALLNGMLTGAALLPAGALAAEWEREAGVTLGAYVSDNICLSDNDHKVWGAGTVTPELLVRGRGARANVYLEAAAEYNSLADSGLDCTSGQSGDRSNRESLIPSLRYRGDLALVQNWLTLESDAFISTNPVDPFAPTGTDNLDGRDNTNITYQYGAGAVVRRRLLDNADMRLRYHRSEQHNAVSTLGDSSENRAEFDLGSRRGSNRLSVGIAGRYSEVMNEGTDRNPAFDNTLASAEVRASLQPSSSLQLNGLVGEEWNEFTSARPEVDGSYWDAGLRWTPNDRVEVTAGTGERFFGTTPRMSIGYRHKRSELTASYARTLTFPRDLRTAGADIEDPLGTDSGANPDFGGLPGDPLIPGGERTFIGNTPVINERLRVRYRFSARRTTFTVAGSNSKQLRTEDRGEATFSEVSATVSRLLTPKLSANTRLSWRESEGEGGNVGIFGQRSQTWRASLGLSRRLGRNTTASARYQHVRQTSDSNRNQYTENRITLSARHAF